MALSIINLLNRTLGRAMEGLNVQLLWLSESNDPIVFESYSNHLGQAIVSHPLHGKVKILVDGEDYGYMETPGVHTIILED